MISHPRSDYIKKYQINQKYINNNNNNKPKRKEKKRKYEHGCMYSTGVQCKDKLWFSVEVELEINSLKGDAWNGCCSLPDGGGWRLRSKIFVGDGKGKTRCPIVTY